MVHVGGFIDFSIKFHLCWLYIRRITSKGRKLPDNLKEIKNKFLVECSRKVINFDKSAIYNMDESSIELVSTN
jgi:hypothetical protein